MERRRVEIGGVLLTLPVAKTQAEQARGLMWRTSLDRDEGMVFEFDHDVQTGYWMKNTFVALDVAFADADGDIFQVLQLEPLDEVSIRPSKPYRWAIEMPRGWFDREMKNAKFNSSV